MSEEQENVLNVNDILCERVEDGVQVQTNDLKNTDDFFTFYDSLCDKLNTDSLEVSEDGPVTYFRITE